MTAEPATRSAKVFYGVRLLSRHELQDADLQSWDALEARSVEPNVYLSPYYVLPAWQHLDARSALSLAVVERHGAGPVEWVGLAVVRRRWATARLPLPHWEIYRSRHAVRGGVLLDQRCAHDAAQALLYALTGRSGWAGAVALDHLLTDGPMADILSCAAALLGHRLTAHHAAPPLDAVVALAGSSAAARRHERIEQCKQRLMALGTLSWRLDRQVLDPAALDAFLRLEHQDWRRELGLSFLSSTQDEVFFRDMVRRHAALGRVWVSELLLNGEPIAASCSLFSASGVGFAFRTGWARQWHELGAALVQEHALAERACDVLGPLALWDNAGTGDLLTDVCWDNRAACTSGVVTAGPLGHWARAAATALSRAAQRCGASPAVASVRGGFPSSGLGALTDRDLILHAGRRWRSSAASGVAPVARSALKPRAEPGSAAGMSRRA